MAEDDDKELKDQRVVTMMTPSELETIDDWMFRNRIRSRGEAIRRLCQIAIAVDRRLPDMFKEHMADTWRARETRNAAIQLRNDPDATTLDLEKATAESDLAANEASLRSMMLLSGLVVLLQAAKHPSATDESIMMLDELQKFFDEVNFSDVKQAPAMTNLLNAVSGDKEALAWLRERTWKK